MTHLLRRHLKTVVQFRESIQAEYIFCVGGCIVETSNSFCTRGTFCTLKYFARVWAGQHELTLSQPGKLRSFKQGMQRVQSVHFPYAGQSPLTHAAQPMHGSQCRHLSQPSSSGWSMQWMQSRHWLQPARQPVHGENSSEINVSYFRQSSPVGSCSGV